MNRKEQIIFSIATLVLGAVIGLVKAGAFEEQTGACAQEAFHLALAVFPGADGRGGGFHGLEKFKGFPAFFAKVIVGGHVRKKTLAEKLSSGNALC